jgi:hypothetical protein
MDFMPNTITIYGLRSTDIKNFGFEYDFEMDSWNYRVEEEGNFVMSVTCHFNGIDGTLMFAFVFDL